LANYGTLALRLLFYDPSAEMQAEMQRDDRAYGFSVRCIKATPSPNPIFPLNVQSTPITNVAITSNTGHGGTTNYTKNVVRGTSVSLTAPSVSGYTFLDWSGCISSTNPTISFSMPANSTTCLANYRPLVSCGDPVTFTYKGSQVTYGTVLSQGKCWMDRNLGASRVATAYNDPLAYGDLFQWGRDDDGHQNRTSDTTYTLSSSDNPGHNKFIVASNFPYDWRSPHNDNLWQGVNGINNPCPSGWRIPTKDEWNTELASWSEKNHNGAFASPLKLTTGGFRHSYSGSPHGVNTEGLYWSSTVSGPYANSLGFYSPDASIRIDHRAGGFSVRCIKN
jgi:uncharacterized protein (TIGR02145 family)